MLQNGVLPARGGTSLSGIVLPPLRSRGCAPGHGRRRSWCGRAGYKTGRLVRRPDGRAANPGASGGSCEGARPLHPYCKLGPSRAAPRAARGAAVEEVGYVEVIGGCDTDACFRLVRCKVLTFLQGAHLKRMSILQGG